ncbi:DNA internalization-related competence protein ComEC/Rec2, partial [Mammaliicoccus fleurettii]|nr:DNA internalization-related competence protein ComEC/Rec2 [Mammaliicoccus fleurettii]
KINNIPINDLVVRNLDGFLYFLIFIVVVSISILVLKKRIVKSITIFSILILAISIRPNYDRVILKFLDIGQGDAMIAYHQDVDKVVMIDTGGKDK